MFERESSISGSILLVLLATQLASAQSGAIRGIVSDPSGAAIVGARVTLQNLQTAGSLHTKSDSSGSYEFAGLSPGIYTVQIEATSFRRAQQEVRLESAEATANVQLEILPEEERVNVTAVARYERSLGEVPVSVTVIPHEEAIQFPWRSIDMLLRNVAGVQLQLNDADQVFPVIPSLAMRGVGVGDTATRALVLVDGIPINGGFFGAVYWNRAPPETIEQVEVVRGASSSLFGSFAMGGAGFGGGLGAPRQVWGGVRIVF